MFYLSDVLTGRYRSWLRERRNARTLHRSVCELLEEAIAPIRVLHSPAYCLMDRIR